MQNHRVFEIYGESARTRGLSQCGHFLDKGEGVNFSRFCTDVLYGRPLTYEVTTLEKKNCRYFVMMHPTFEKHFAIKYFSNDLIVLDK